jgi:hypothetical protein
MEEERKKRKMMMKISRWLILISDINETTRPDRRAERER